MDRRHRWKWDQKYRSIVSIDSIDRYHRYQSIDPSPIVPVYAKEISRLKLAPAYSTFQAIHLGDLVLLGLACNYRTRGNPVCIPPEVWLDPQSFCRQSGEPDLIANLRSASSSLAMRCICGWAFSPTSVMSDIELGLISGPRMSNWRRRSPTLCSILD
jgi:hypothetical protein